MHCIYNDKFTFSDFFKRYLMSIFEDTILVDYGSKVNIKMWLNMVDPITTKFTTLLLRFPITTTLQYQKFHEILCIGGATTGMCQYLPNLKN